MKSILAGLIFCALFALRAAVPPEIEKALNNTEKEPVAVPSGVSLLPRMGFTPLQLGLGPLMLADPSDPAFLNINLYSEKQTVAGLSLTLYSRMCTIYGVDVTFSNLESDGAGLRIAGMNACKKYAGFTCAIFSRITENFGVAAALYNRSGGRRGKRQGGWNLCQIGVTNHAENGLQLGLFNTNLKSYLPFFFGMNFSVPRAEAEKIPQKAPSAEPADKRNQ